MTDLAAALARVAELERENLSLRLFNRQAREDIDMSAGEWRRMSRVWPARLERAEASARAWQERALELAGALDALSLVERQCVEMSAWDEKDWPMAHDCIVNMRDWARTALAGEDGAP